MEVSSSLRDQYLASVRNGDVERCKAVLAAGLNADQVFKINSQPIPVICVAVERGSYALVKLLLESGVVVNRRDSRGRTCLHVAAERGYYDIGQLLLQHKADPNAADDMLVTPLHLAAERCSLGLVSSLVFYGADVNSRNAYGRFPLYVACSSLHANTSVVVLLLDNGAHVNETDDAGYSSLDVAVMTFKPAIVRLLILRGSRLQLWMPKGGTTLLHFAISTHHPDKKTLLELLIKKGCDMNKPNDIGQTPAHLACILQDIDSLRTLISAGANPNTTDSKGISPLAHCINEGKERFAKLLVEGGARENLETLNVQLLSSPFRKLLLHRLHSPPPLTQLSRASLCKHYGAYFRDWTNEHLNNIPLPMQSFLKFEL